MAYHRYVTRGIVLRSVGQGEKDLYCRILTEDLGSISATAKSARIPRSKLSPGIQQYSLSLISFVRGKHSWKIVGVQNIAQTQKDFIKEKAKRTLWARYLSLIRRLVVGEEKHPELFTVAIGLFETLKRRAYKTEELFAIECIAVLILLHELGHIAHIDEYNIFFEQQFSEAAILEALRQKDVLKEVINTAITSTDL